MGANNNSNRKSDGNNHRSSSSNRSWNQRQSHRQVILLQLHLRMRPARHSPTAQYQV
jgi:hypothetical protein